MITSFSSYHNMIVAIIKKRSCDATRESKLFRHHMYVLPTSQTIFQKRPLSQTMQARDCRETLSAKQARQYSGKNKDLYNPTRGDQRNQKKLTLEDDALPEHRCRRLVHRVSNPHRPQPRYRSHASQSWTRCTPKDKNKTSQKGGTRVK